MRQVGLIYPEADDINAVTHLGQSDELPFHRETKWKYNYTMLAIATLTLRF